MRLDEVVRQGDKRTLEDIQEWLDGGYRTNSRVLAADNLRLTMQLNPPIGTDNHHDSSNDCKYCEDLVDEVSNDVRHEYDGMEEELRTKIRAEIEENLWPT